MAYIVMAHPPAERAVKLTCTGEKTEGERRALHASMAIRIRHAVLPVFGRVRVRLLSNTNANTSSR